ncbi:LTA synthase family protein [Butyrivibrio sp. AE3003]|uniref:LTA synthase family protein n=1 Tax=Butyrivibrio sp. AE3003 TaxID=1496721 RepID=UPI00047C93A2|nr:LTA synthase family protein [Butyrivibrio sp. AE3003]
MTSRDISLIAKRGVRNASFDIRRLLKMSWRYILRLLISVLVVYMCFLIVETGSVTSFRGAIPVSFFSGVLFLNFSIFAFLLSILYLFVGNDVICSVVSVTISSIIAIINHYVILLHGMPLTFQEIQNFGTALNVIRGATLAPDETFFKIIGLFFFGVFFALALYLIDGKKKEVWGDGLWKRLIYSIVTFAIFDMVVLSPVSKKPESILAWSWREVYPTYGYALCSLESFQNLRNVVSRPDNYDVADIPTFNVSTWYSQERPDIILILNETFYDFGVVTDLETDTEYMPYISGMDDVKKGYVVVPNYGGGTNATEYELLTGNSNKLINNMAPFNVLDMNNSLSVVSILNELEYETTAMHSESGSNYSRYRGYEELGFDNVYFGEDFHDLEYYANRAYATDKSLYDNMIKKYESNVAKQAGGENVPQFMYLLTIQNHGGWDQNPESEDVIHSLKDYGASTDTLNEFLSCIQASDKAFYDLINYYKKVDRPVVVCMLGDHCPSFAYDVMDKEMSPDIKEYNLRRTPFLMWSNVEMQKSWTDSIGTVSTNYVIPMLLKELDMPRPAYYQYMTQIADKYPVLGSGMRYMDDKETAHLYDEAPIDVNGYFFMEYNNIGDRQGNIPDLFRVQR